MIDIHSHILPKIDDGAETWEMSLAMARIAVEDGIKTMAATPHMLNGVYNVSRDQILTQVEELRRRLKEENIDLEIVAGADTHVTQDFMTHLNDGTLLTINDAGKYILVEFPQSILEQATYDMLFEIQLAGVIPVITHPERYFDIQRNYRIAYKWAESGNIIQVTAASLVGELGEAAQTSAMRLLKEGIVHVVASDAHSTEWRRPVMSSARRLVADVLSEDHAELIFLERPRCIVAGDYVEVPSPEDVKPSGKPSWYRKLQERWF